MRSRWGCWGGGLLTRRATAATATKTATIATTRAFFCTPNATFSTYSSDDFKSPKATSDDHEFLTQEVDSFNQELALVFGKDPQEMESRDRSPSSARTSAARPWGRSHRGAHQATSNLLTKSNADPHALMSMDSPPKDNLSIRTRHPTFAEAIKPRPRVQTTMTGVQRVELLEGPCLYARDRLIGTRVRQEEVHRHAKVKAEQFGMALQCKHSNHVGQIVEWVLDADSSALILHWNDDLAKYPSLCRALELVERPVVLLTPTAAYGARMDVSRLVGVISGFNAQTRIALGLEALVDEKKRERK